MNFAGHVSLGCAAWFGYVVMNTSSADEVLSPKYLLAVPVVIFGALLPDIDHPDSTFGKRIRPVSTVLSWFTHRGITHSLWAVAACIYLLSALEMSFFWLHAMTLGYLSHLLGDALTPSGIKPFWPLPYRFYVNPLVGFFLTFMLFVLYEGV